MSKFDSNCNNTSLWLWREQFRPVTQTHCCYWDCYWIHLQSYGKAIQFEVHEVCRGLLKECGLLSPGSFPGPTRISRHQIQRGRSRTRAAVATLVILSPGRVPQLPLILRDLGLSPHTRGAGVTSATVSVIGWGGQGFPQIQLRREGGRGTKKKNAWWEKQM